MKHFALASLTLVPLLCAQDTRPGSRSAVPGTPPHPRTPEPESDPKAVAIATKVLEAIGGNEGLAQLHCIQWTFAGSRTHTWDRVNGRHRLEMTSGKKKTLMLRDLKAGTCRVFINGEEVTDEAELAESKSNAEQIFVNDTYWFLFPAKLLDAGVVLALEPDQKIEDHDCHVLRVRFKEVGFTPKNEYQAFVDQKTSRVIRWTYYRTKDAPGMTWDWGPYERVGPLQLAGKHKAVGHGRDVDITGLQAFPSAKDEWFAPPKAEAGEVKK